jgi:hypothetical protein
MSKNNHKRKHDPVLSAIMVTADDIRRLSQLTNSSEALSARGAFPFARNRSCKRRR